MNDTKKKILVVDDEADIRDGLREYLQLKGYTVDAAASADEALALGVAGYDLLLLDVMMEGMDGLELASRLKNDASTSHVPIIFLTARDTDDDVVAGFSLGAEDYVAKPFSMKVLMARVENVLRRMSGKKSTGVGVTCDRMTLSCCVDGNEVKLPRKEFEILAFLLENPGRIFTREELMKQVWPDNVVVVDRSVDVHVTRIRSKISPYGKHIVSRSGYGYGWME